MEPLESKSSEPSRESDALVDAIEILFDCALQVPTWLLHGANPEGAGVGAVFAPEYWIRMMLEESAIDELEGNCDVT